MDVFCPATQTLFTGIRMPHPWIVVTSNMWRHPHVTSRDVLGLPARGALTRDVFSDVRDLETLRNGRALDEMQPAMVVAVGPDDVEVFRKLPQYFDLFFRREAISVCPCSTQGYAEHGVFRQST